MPTPDPARLRQAYEGSELGQSAVPTEPFAFFTIWFTDAVNAGLPEPNAMILATASAAGEPSARTVLLKGHGPDGFRFFTNHTSRKGRELLANPRAALVFPWHAMQRQVRVAGPVLRLSEEESADYFHSRPHGSQLGAWASPRQSAVIESRDELVQRYAELSERWPDPKETPQADQAPDPVPLPDFWGGYRLIPLEIEFWIGRPDRLHDRIRYRRPTEAEPWQRERLSP